MAPQRNDGKMMKHDDLFDDVQGTLSILENNVWKISEMQLCKHLWDVNGKAIEPLGWHNYIQLSA